MEKNADENKWYMLESWNRSFRGKKQMKANDWFWKVSIDCLRKKTNRWKQTIDVRKLKSIILEKKNCIKVQDIS
jgi:hypothetical protein